MKGYHRPKSNRVCAFCGEGSDIQIIHKKFAQPCCFACFTLPEKERENQHDKKENKS